MQHEALTFSSFDANTSQLFQNLNWKNLSTQRDIHKPLMVFKSLNGLTPDYLGSKFIALSNASSYTFRDSVNKLTLFLNNNEILGELLRENVISSHVKILPFA